MSKTLRGVSGWLGLLAVVLTISTVAIPFQTWAIHEDLKRQYDGIEALSLWHELVLFDWIVAGFQSALCLFALWRLTNRFEKRTVPIVAVCLWIIGPVAIFVTVAYGASLSSKVHQADSAIVSSKEIYKESPEPGNFKETQKRTFTFEEARGLPSATDEPNNIGASSADTPSPSNDQSSSEIWTEEDRRQLENFQSNTATQSTPKEASIARSDDATLAGFLLSLIQTILWTGYLARSRRVKNTYGANLGEGLIQALQSRLREKRQRQFVFICIVWVVLSWLFLLIFEPFPSRDGPFLSIILLPPILAWIGTKFYRWFVLKERGEKSAE